MRYFKGINRRTMSTGSRWGLPWVRMRVGVIGKDSGGWNVLELCALLCKYTQSYRTQTSFTTNAKLGLNKLLRKTLRGNKSPWLQAAEVTSNTDPTITLPLPAPKGSILSSVFIICSSFHVVLYNMLGWSTYC